MAANSRQSHDESDGRRRSQPPPKSRTPLLSRAAKDFLDGDIDAKHYMRKQRVQAIEKAQEEVSAHLGGSRLYTSIGISAISIAYVLLGITSFLDRGIGLGSISLLTAVAFAAASYALSRRR
jgi:hypothetical protein